MTIIELMVVRLRMFNWLQLILHIVKWEDLKKELVSLPLMYLSVAY